MRTKPAAGWTALLLISLIPVFLWMRWGPGTREFVDYASITHSLGELFGLVAMTMFALTFLLSARISWIEDVFGGLDRVYMTHGILGGTALILILAHPIFLVLKFVPSRMDQAAAYLLPSSSWSVNLGIIALLGMVVLLFITLFTKMRYDRWKFTHEFMGLMFLLTVLHIFLVRGTISQDDIFAGYYAYASVVAAIGLFGFSYSLFIKNRLFKNAVYAVKSIRRKKDIFEITITPEHKPLSYKAGQFIFLRFYNEQIPKEAHPFSIASGSDDHDIVVVVKELGDYTRKLVHLREGDKVSVEGPYGRFDHKRYGQDERVWIAGGIGVTPFLGMARDITLTGTPLEGSILFFYSVKRQEDLIGGALFSEIDRRVSRFSFIPWISHRQGRMTAQTVRDVCGTLKKKQFFLCGPTGFKEGIIKGLLASGVRRSHIHEEAFDFR
ncbi:MAG: hypothetical protein GXP63_03020 [DPANN group archaeon]|nr:hypothetical protein [DPANN group archaeon]